jgi:hypothetical protein
MPHLLKGPCTKARSNLIPVILSVTIHAPWDAQHPTKPSCHVDSRKPIPAAVEVVTRLGLMLFLVLTPRKEAQT